MTYLDFDMHASMLVICLLVRNAQRIMHIPFFPYDQSLSQTEKMRLEKELKAATDFSSSSIGHIIKMGEDLVAKVENQDRILLYISKCLPGMPYRIHKAYALLFAAAELVSQ